MSLDYLLFVTNFFRTDTRSSRLLVSQDYSDIFLGLAKCHPDYLAYLKTGKVTANAFLTMQTYGPYEITSQKDMRDIANVMTAIIVVAKNAA